MTYQDIIFERGDGFATITLNRPDRLNAMRYQTLGEINAAVRDIAEDPETRVLVIRGAGRAFCSGDDIKGMGEPSRKALDLFTRSDEVGYISVLRSLQRLPKPIIVAIHGYALGAGLDLALACDIRLMSSDSKVGMPYATLGYAAGTYLLPRTVGPTRAIEMLFSARHVSAEEALESGIATEVVPTVVDLQDATSRWVDLLLARPTKSLGYMKDAVHRSYENDFEAGFELLRLHRVLVENTADFVEGKSAWLSKREPRFKGR